MEKKFLYSCIGMTIIFLALVMGVTYYFDPLQQIHSTKYSSGESRILTAGLVKTAEYDTLIFGTSTAGGLLKKDVHNILGVNAINVAMPGATSYEQQRLLKLALHVKKANKVILGLDSFAYNRECKEVLVEISENFFRDSFMSKIQSLISLNQIKQIFSVFFGRDGKEIRANWKNEGESRKKYKHAQSLVLTLNTKNEELSPSATTNWLYIETFQKGQNLENMKRNYDGLLELIAKNPKVQFCIFFPPYSGVFWYYADIFGSFEDILEFKKYVISKSKALPNMEILDFQDKEDIVLNFNEYRDIIHYSPKISNQLILEISKKTGKIDYEKYDFNFKALRSIVETVKEKYGEQLQKELKENEESI